MFTTEKQKKHTKIIKNRELLLLVSCCSFEKTRREREKRWKILEDSQTARRSKLSRLSTPPKKKSQKLNLKDLLKREKERKRERDFFDMKSFFSLFVVVIVQLCAGVNGTLQSAYGSWNGVW